MKALITGLCFLLVVLVGPSFVMGSPFLACDPSTALIKVVEVEITMGTVITVVPGIYVVMNGNNVRLLDLAGRPNGAHKFRVRWHDGSGWWSDWSDPLDAAKPAKGGLLRIIP